MTRKLQLAGWLVALMSISAALVAQSFAQGPRANAGQNRPNKPAAQPQRQPQRQERRQPQQAAPRAQNERQNSGANRPPSSNGNRPETTSRPNNNPNRPPSAYTPPPQRKFNDLSPQEKQKVVENYNKQKNLPPLQRREIDDR